MKSLELLHYLLFAGMAAARERGAWFGRPRTLANRAPEIMKLHGQAMGVRAIARELNMPVSSVHPVPKAAGALSAANGDQLLAV